MKNAVRSHFHLISNYVTNARIKIIPFIVLSFSFQFSTLELWSNWNNLKWNMKRTENRQFSVIKLNCLAFNKMYSSFTNVHQFCMHSNWKILNPFDCLMDPFISFMRCHNYWVGTSPNLHFERDYQCYTSIDFFSFHFPSFEWLTQFQSVIFSNIILLKA